MGIAVASTLLHWNYFLALEQDLERLARYVEFRAENFGVFSIELARLLFAAASEVDVVAKLLCKRFDPKSRCDNIKKYQAVLMRELATLPHEQVHVPRYGLSFKPWLNWDQPDTSPNWWSSYNKVKHQRDAHFNQATLQHALNALGALLILTYHHYSYELAAPGACLLPKDTMEMLRPQSALLQLDGSYYPAFLRF